MTECQEKGMYCRFKENINEWYKKIRMINFLEWLGVVTICSFWHAISCYHVGCLHAIRAGYSRNC